MIPSIHRHSNPIGTLARLLHVHQPVIDIRALNKKGDKDLEFLIDIGLERENDRNFLGVMEMYREYQNLFLDNLYVIKGLETIFLNFENLILQSKYGNLGRECIDDFSSETHVAQEFMRMYLDKPESERKAMENILYYRLGLYDFPFMIGFDRDAKIYNPFKEVAIQVSELLVNKGKKPLGSYERYMNDTSTRGNTLFSDTAISVSKFREELTEEQLAMLTMKYNEFMHKHYEIDSVSEERFKKLCEQAIHLNWHILEQKYKYILEELGIEEPFAYTLKGDLGLKLLTSINSKTRVIGEKPLRKTKRMPVRSILELEALNKLSGWIKARYGRLEEDPTIIKGVNFDRYVTFPVQLPESTRFPYLMTLSNPKLLEDQLEDADPAYRESLEKDMHRYKASAATIEFIILSLNLNNFRVYTDQETTQWQDILNESKIHPLKIDHVSREVERFTRPSSTSALCEFHKYISLFDEEYWPWDTSNEVSRSGTLMHEIGNTMETEDNEVLKEQGIKTLHRKEYCEVSLVHEFTPTEEELESVKEIIEKKLYHTNNLFWAEVLGELSKALVNGITIQEPGTTDGAAYIETTNIPIVIDYKRFMATPNPKPSFFEQTARYGLGIIQGLNMNTDRMYSVIVQTPNSPAKYVPQQFEYQGIHRRPRITIREIYLESSFMNKVLQDLIIERLSTEVFRRDVNLGYEFNNRYNDPQNKDRANCQECFANKPESPQCRYLLENVKEHWPAQKIEKEQVL